MCEKFEQLNNSIQILQDNRRRHTSPNSIPSNSQAQSTSFREVRRNNSNPEETPFNRQTPPHMPSNEQPREENSNNRIEVPRIKEWPKFTGEGEYDHLEFIRTIDLFKEDFDLGDIGISGRLSSLFKGNARRWFNDVRLANGRQPWSWWKEQITNKWGSPAWRYKLENKFDESIFDVEKDSPVKWFLTQKDRLQALWPNMSVQDMHLRILKKCGGDLEHAIKSRAPRDASSEDIINILEDITTRTRIGRKYKPYKNMISEKLDYKQNSNNSGNKESSKDINPYKDKKCYTCQKMGHTSTSCPQKRKNVNQVDATGEQAEPEIAEKEESIHDFDDESSISEMSNNMIQADLDIADVVYDNLLPQEWQSGQAVTNITEARLMKTKPVRGKGYTAGKSNLTAVIFNDQEAEMLLDSGAFCSIVSKTYLQKLAPDFRDSLLPAG